MSTVSGISSVLLQGITWQQYVDFRDLEENNHVRMTYDRGNLELMLPSRLPYVVLEGVTWRQYVELRDNPQNDHVPVEHLVEMVNRRSSADETTRLREFRAACRQMAGGRE